ADQRNPCSPAARRHNHRLLSRTAYGNVGHSGGEGTGALFPATIYESTPLFTYNDTISWTRGTHAFKTGGEARFTASRLEDQGTSNAWRAHGRVMGGETPLTPVQGINT